MSEFKTFTKEILDSQHLSILREIGRRIGVKAPASMKKDKLIDQILAIQKGDVQPVPVSKRGAPPKINIDVSNFLIDMERDCVYDAELTETKFSDSKIVDRDAPVKVEGVLQLFQSGYGFLRNHSYDSSDDDVYVSTTNVAKYNLRDGDKVQGLAKSVQYGNAISLQEVHAINDLAPEAFKDRANFDELDVCYPEETIALTECVDGVVEREIDLFCPIAKGQRGVIVGAPRTGKMSLIKTIANTIEKNYKDIKLIVVLIDESPEEISEIKRSVNCEIACTTFDKKADKHLRLCDHVLRRAKRIVEVGTDVVILLSSLTKLARASNACTAPSGKTLVGGLDPAALLPIKKLLSFARNVQGNGSLTFISTADVQTGSKFDDVVFDELRSSFNLCIKTSERVFETGKVEIDILESFCNKPDQIIAPMTALLVQRVKAIASNDIKAKQSLYDMLSKVESKQEFIAKLNGWIKLYQK